MLKRIACWLVGHDWRVFLTWNGRTTEVGPDMAHKVLDALAEMLPGTKVHETIQCTRCLMVTP